MANLAENGIRRACYRGGFADAKSLYFGNSNDVGIQWDGTNLIPTPSTDDYLIEIADSGSTQKSFDLKWYGNEASGASYLYFDASANLIYSTGVDLQFKDSDYLVFGTGSGATGDVQITWDATNLLMTCSADDSVIEIGDSAATQKSFDVKIYGNGANGVDYLLWDASANKFSFVGAAIMEMGTSSAKVIDDTAGRRFISLYTDCGATSGYSYGIRAAHYITGAGGGGAAMRPYLVVDGVAAKSAYAIEATASISATAGSSVDADEMCTIKATADVNLSTSGTVNVLNLTINAAASKTMHANSAFVCVQNTGDGADIRNLFYFADARGAAGAATIVNTDHANDIVTGANLYVKCRDATGDFWLLGTTTAPAAA